MPSPGRMPRLWWLRQVVPPTSEAVKYGHTIRGCPSMLRVRELTAEEEEQIKRLGPLADCPCPRRGAGQDGVVGT